MSYENYEMKVKDLEDENKSLVAENEKLMAFIEKYKSCATCVDIEKYTEKCHLCVNCSNWRLAK